MAEVKILADGTVEVYSGVQDIGGGARTLVALAACRSFNYMPIDKIKTFIGQSNYSGHFGSAGSATTRGLVPDVEKACKNAKNKFFMMLAPEMKTEFANLELRPGGLVGIKGQKQPTLTWLEATAKIRECVIGYAEPIAGKDVIWYYIKDDGTMIEIKDLSEYPRKYKEAGLA